MSGPGSTASPVTPAHATVIDQLAAATGAALAAMPRTTVVNAEAARSALEASVSRYLVALGEPALARQYLARCQHDGKHCAATA